VPLEAFLANRFGQHFIPQTANKEAA
jgi:hypothetical protein